MINGTLAALLDREGDQTTLPADDLEEQFQAMRRLVASKAGFGAFISLPMWVDLWKSLFIYVRLLLLKFSLEDISRPFSALTLFG